MRIKNLKYSIFIAGFSLFIVTAFQPPPFQHLKKPFHASNTNLYAIDTSPSEKFDLDVALFLGGVAFDAYVEPPANSSRWERGSKGMNVAFLSNAFTRNLYKGLVEVTPLSCSGLPDDQSLLEGALTGSGVDAAILVAAVEGQWKEDIELLKKQYHEGIFELSGATHIGRSSTAWANIDEKQSNAHKKKTGKALPFHVKKDWFKDASAIWPEEDPFYLYVQDPENVQLLFTLLDDDVIGEGKAVGSTYVALRKLLPPMAKYSQDKILERASEEVLQRLNGKNIESTKIDEEIAKAVNREISPWEGELSLTSKPRIKNKNGQVALGVTAGAMVLGPAGAAVGGAIASQYEGRIKGKINLRLRYLPIPQSITVPYQGNHQITGGMPGINWGCLYEEYLAKQNGKEREDKLSRVQMTDLEHCFFIEHEVTGCSCGVYRSLQNKLIIVSFRGTCTPIDLVTDASVVQTPWIEGENPTDLTAKVHVGFRKSMNSISRRLKELLIASVAPGDNISEYDMLVTGHSLGGALATLFVADIGEFGLDAGRGLPQQAASDPWWKSITSRFLDQMSNDGASKAPPRPKSLRMYNFGSPRVGNKAFSKRFDQLLQDRKIDQAYRIVNNQDVVARMPRTMYTLGTNYDHCGSTVIVQEACEGEVGPNIWIEGETDDRDDPVRDQARIASPTGEGTLLGDLLSMTKVKPEEGGILTKLQGRLSSVTASDITSVVGLNKSFTEREIKMVQALFKGDGLSHHMEDSYYSAMGLAAGFLALVNEDVIPLSRGSNIPDFETLSDSENSSRLS
mmetsp:Transcript_18437/g.24348  ORF Transcript_18437/g.24348 Transcript_18437/m.24348 type:complete len:794 (-) Transcript_18437:218-2599(-)